MKLTEAQKKAISKRNCSLLISAGAGSGKTAVLTERIIERLCNPDDNCVITDFLIVTFTNAAAGELAERIRKKLLERALLNPKDKRIIKNLSLLPLAKISTINAFCFDLVKKNYQKLGLSPNVRIADDSEMGVLRRHIMNKVLDEAFENSTDTFLATLEIFSGAKSDESFIDTLLKLDYDLHQTTDKELFKANVLDMYSEVSECESFFDTKYGKFIKDISKQKTQSCISHLEKLYDMCFEKHELLRQKYCPAIDDDIKKAKVFLKEIDDGYEKTRHNLSHYELSRFGIIKNFEDEDFTAFIRSARKSSVDLIRKDLSALYSADENTIKNASFDCSVIIKELFCLLDVFDKKLSYVKASSGIVDFGDVEHYSLKLLTDSIVPFIPSDFAEDISRDFKEIYIDEYQDVNELQDLIFRAICSKDKNNIENSRFLVGDIKQSIYRFRGARPDIFKKYREDFVLCSDQEQSPVQKIFMQNNFRSSENVISLTNFLFSRLMGGDFEPGDELIFSREQNTKTAKKCHLTILNADKDDADFDTSEQSEAYIIAQKIKQIVDNPSELKSDGKTISYSDICILTRSKSTLNIYESVLSGFGIPVFGDAGENFYGKKEVLLMLCILNSIDNPEREIYLAGFMRSVIGGFTDDELAIIKHKFKKCRLFTSVKNYAQCDDEDIDTTLKNKCDEFLHRLFTYRKFARGNDASKLVWLLYCDMDLFSICSSSLFGEGSPDEYASRKKNLLKLYDMARDFTKTSFKGIGAFIEYLNGSMDKADIKAERIIGGNYVTLMTIHRSKGLEFPVCFVADLARNFNKTDERKKLIFAENACLGIKLRDVKGLKCQKSGSGSIVIDTPFRLILSQIISQSAIREEVRILYVALTRARDHLYMSGCIKGDFSKVLNKARLCYATGDFSGCSNYLSMILGCIISDKVCLALLQKSDMQLDGLCDNLSDILECEYLNMQDLNDITNSLLASPSTEIDCNNTEDSPLTDKLLLEKLNFLSSFVYPHRDILDNLPSKLTVSQLKKGLLDDDSVTLLKAKRDYKAVPDFIKENLSPSSADAGTAMHLFMQFANFDDCVLHGCLSQADYLLQKGFIDKKNRTLLNIEKLDEFFKTQFYKDISLSKNIRREMRFNLNIDASEFSEKLEPGKNFILVQGVIDLFYENADGSFTVVDFKTDKVSLPDGDDILRERHSAQLIYYSRAVKEITGKEVSRAVLYSFEMMKPVEVDLSDI